VKNFKKGERVVVAFDIGCGSCFFCNKQLFSSCTNTNPTKEMEQLYGDRTAGMFGYSHLTGGHAGGQAEFARVPFADTNLLKIPEELQSVSDEKLLFFSDILPTAWHSVELGNVSKGDVVAIWGAGPVGILAARLAQIRGAKRVIVIDQEAYRLKFLQEKVPGTEIINFAQDKDVVGKLKEMTNYGPDVAIEAVGCHYTKSLVHTIQTKVGLETDSGDMLNEVIQAVRKGGRISVVGAYVGTVNMFNIGAFMEKQLTMAAGQTPCQKYWPTLLDLVQKGEIDPSMVISHVMSLEDAPKGYSIFNDKKDNCIKVVLKPSIKA
jgi:threonine dehydrogenase-like Zn-dependent dehydrogenase